MFKFGEYSEDEARYIANYLKEVGMKVDIRTFTDGRLEVFNYLEGRMSELKGDIEEKDFEDYERFINALRAILARGATAENFREMLRIELDPAVNDKSKQVSEIFEGSLPEEERKIKIDDEFKEEYGEEFLKISNLGDLISGLAEPFSGKMDMKSFSERCNFQSEDDGNILKVIGKGSAPEMARALEKNGIIKVKGDIIRCIHLSNHANPRA